MKNSPAAIYLDYAATAPLHPQVFKAYQEAFAEGAQFNPSSPHAAGRKAKDLLEGARRRVAEYFEVPTGSIVFTSGATESNHLALWGLSGALKNHQNLITSATEHPSVISALQSQPYIQSPVLLLPSYEDGTLQIPHLEEALRQKPGLLSVMAANNETGVRQDIQMISALCRRRSVPFHCDAVQAVPYLAGAELSRSCDLMTISGHKLGAPRGIGALVISEPKFRLKPLFTGGSQEDGRRSGTENVAGAIALAAALELGLRDWESLEKNRDQFERRLKTTIPSAQVHGENARRLPGFSCFSVPGIVGEAMLRWLDGRGIAVSTGSACSTGKKMASPVILAMTGDEELARSSLRLSFAQSLGEDMQKHVVTTIKEGIEHLRRVQGGIL